MVESISGKKLNKGEWAEFYVMLRLLGEGRLYTADGLLRKNMKTYLDVMKIIRQEYDVQVLEYIIDQDKTNVIIKPQGSDDILASIPTEEFQQNASELFESIRSSSGSSLPAPESVCHFAKIIYVSKPKAPAIKSLKKQFGGKNDIIIEVRDSQTAIVSIMGFSIKAQFGSSPTLFNAGSSSQFLFKLSGCDDAMMEEFNRIHDDKGRGWIKCREYLSNHNISIDFAKTKNPVYGSNLVLIRDSMPEILAWCVKDRLITTYKDPGVFETTQRLIAANPLNVPNCEVFYEKTIKDFLMTGFTGMTAAKEWDGKEQVNGGYIVVMDDGDVLCYHSSDREAFRDYLYKNTHFEYVGSNKYNWSYIEKVNGEYYLPLNISIRFNSGTR